MGGRAGEMCEVKRVVWWEDSKQGLKEGREPRKPLQGQHDSTKQQCIVQQKVDSCLKQLQAANLLQSTTFRPFQAVCKKYSRTKELTPEVYYKIITFILDSITVSGLQYTSSP